MQRITITLDDDLADDLDAWMETHGAQSRSEAMRDLLRRGMAAQTTPPEGAQCYAVVSYVADLTTRNLAARLPQDRLNRHDQAVATLSVPLDHSHAVEVSVMRGEACAISQYAQALFLERGIYHGTLGVIPVEADSHSHSHPEDAHTHHHMRVLPGF